MMISGTGKLFAVSEVMSKWRSSISSALIRSSPGKTHTLRPVHIKYPDRQFRGRLASDWNLIVPSPILSREWEAVR